MAVDTRNKRASAAVQGMSALSELLPLADGTVGQADRQQVAWTYPGILAQVPTLLPLPLFTTGQRVFVFSAADRTYLFSSKDRSV